MSGRRLGGAGRAVGFNLVMLADADAGHARPCPPRGRRGAFRPSAGRGRGSRIGRAAVRRRRTPATDGSLTDPDLAAAFVRETGVDLLAVSAGNVHVLLHGQRELDLAHLAAIRRKVDVPLVLHGGSGIAAGSLVQPSPWGWPRSTTAPT